MAVGGAPANATAARGDGGGLASLGDGARWRFIAARPSGGQSPDKKERLIKARAQRAMELVPSTPPGPIGDLWAHVTNAMVEGDG